MAQWNKMLKELHNSIPEKFNEEIFHLKEKDDILQHISDACSSLESIQGIKFLGAKKIDERTLYKPSKDITDIPYERSRLIAIEIKFELKDPKSSETKLIKKKLYFPKLIDGCYYLIDDVKYYPIFQIVDAETYKTNNSITMRTSLQPIVVSKKNISMTPENTLEEIEGYYTFSKIFNTKIPIFIYFFANFGITNTLKYFDLEDTFEIIDKKRIDFDEHEDDYLFKLGSMLYLSVPKKYMDESLQNKVMVFTFVNAFQKKDKVSTEKIDDKDYWIRKLGSYFTKNQTNFDNKGKSVKASFERLLDNTTKRVIRIPDRDKENIYSLLRWFLINYDSLLYQNNDDLANKRLRLNECFIFPLLEVWTQGVLRVLNGKNITLKTLESLFSNIQPDFLVKKIKTADNLRYMNNVDSIDILNKMKLTIAGNQSISNSRGEIRGKTLDPSMIGNIDVIYTSNNDPGTTRALSIGAKVNDTWHFTEEPNIISNGFEGEEYDNLEELEDSIYEDVDVVQLGDDDFTFDIDDE
jgi:hypothetical protein